MKDNMLKVTMENGTTAIIEIMDMAYNEDGNKTYIVYKFIDGTDYFISILTDNSIDTIEDADEFKAVEQFFVNNLKKENGEIML